MQNVAWFLSLGLMALVTAVFAAVSLGAAGKAEVAKPYRGRSALIWGLLIVGAAITYATLKPWPQAAYARDTPAPALTIQAIGHQWRWDLSATEVPVGQPVAFMVSAADVNHGFAIYRHRTQVLGQIQAMPGFTNRLVVTFPEPGDYEVLCLEYCGVAHHAMVTTITAK
jgi:cytochrome c oxidase subunit 2